MPVLRKLHLVRRDAEVLQDAMLKFVFEYLAVAVNDELASDQVEHDASSRPFLVFGFTYDGARVRPEGALFSNLPRGRSGREGW